MRLLQVSLDSDVGTVVDLHPLFSVVHSLDQASKDRLVRTVTGSCTGRSHPGPV